MYMQTQYYQYKFINEPITHTQPACHIPTHSCQYCNMIHYTHNTKTAYNVQVQCIIINYTLHLVNMYYLVNMYNVHECMHTHCTHTCTCVLYNCMYMYMYVELMPITFV